VKQGDPKVPQGPEDLEVPQEPVWAIDHVLIPRSDYEELVALRTRAKAKLAQLKQQPTEAAQKEHIRVLEWLLLVAA
jgi:hypothetical protein